MAKEGSLQSMWTTMRQSADSTFQFHSVQLWTDVYHFHCPAKDMFLKEKFAYLAPQQREVSAARFQLMSGLTRSEHALIPDEASQIKPANLTA
ncbi:GM14784 [Drosophila sechellia]|uniref:GM14784 n=1 Tax=Drosophila sechellia TaxID=7238 RepID=B4HXH4_DROSE|nr:GM14784 [Drosophila sechellia]